MITEQIIKLQIGDKIHIPDVKNQCETWEIETRFGEDALLAMRPAPSGRYRYNTLINPNRYNLVNIHLASECQHEQRSTHNGTY